MIVRIFLCFFGIFPIWKPVLEICSFLFTKQNMIHRVAPALWATSRKRSAHTWNEESSNIFRLIFGHLYHPHFPKHSSSMKCFCISIISPNKVDALPKPFSMSCSATFLVLSRPLYLMFLFRVHLSPSLHSSFSSQIQQMILLPCSHWYTIHLYFANLDIISSAFASFRHSPQNFHRLVSNLSMLGEVYYDFPDSSERV